MKLGNMLLLYITTLKASIAGKLSILAYIPRPTVMADNVVRKLLKAFKLDVTVEEACLYADISKDTFYRKLNEDEEFSDEIGRARMYATMAARLSVVKALP